MSNKIYAGNTEVEEVCEKKKKILELPGKIKSVPRRWGKKIWEVGREDPRRAIHALKVGVSLTLVSLLYLMEPLFKGIGSNAIWAVMTVVVVLEFSAGATLCKGLNRGLGTLIAGSLAFFIEFVANDSGKVLRAIFIGSAVFLVGAAATYLRFVPYIKKNFDYGVVIFLLTFNLLIESSYLVGNVLKVAHDRLFTIAIGCGICLFMTLLVFPIWSGEDLHNSTVAKFHGLAQSIEACVNEYFDEKDKEIKEEEESPEEDKIYRGYKAVLDSKSSDEALALYASWEPRHTRQCYRFPWEQYVKVGAVLRHFGYTVVALHGCLRTEIQTPRSVRALFKDPCLRLAGEVTKVLTELANSIHNRRHSSPEILSDHLHVALQDLNSAIKSQPKLFLGSNLHRRNAAVSHHPQTTKPQNDTVYQRLDSLNDAVTNQQQNDKKTQKQNGLVSNQLNDKAQKQNDAVSIQQTNKAQKKNGAVSNQQNDKARKQNGAVSLASVRTDTSALLEFRKSSKRGNNVNSEIAAAAAATAGEKRMLRSQMSKMAVMTSLEFSEALPFAAFASLLVEMVARLDNVIEEVEELGRIACFKEYDNTGDKTKVAVKCEIPANQADVVARNQLASHGSAVVD